MAVSPGLKRLFEVRELEEKLSEGALEEALGELHGFEAAFKTAKNRERSGRRQITASAGSADAADRIAALEETRAARRHAEMLAPRVAAMEAEVAARREAFLAKRTERRQAETLIQEIEARDAAVALRRSQRDLDDWFLTDSQRASGPAAPEGKK